MPSDTSHRGASSSPGGDPAGQGHQSSAGDTVEAQREFVPRCVDHVIIFFAYWFSSGGVGNEAESNTPVEDTFVAWGVRLPRALDRNRDGRVDFRDIVESHVVGEAAEDRYEGSSFLKSWKFVICQCLGAFLLWLILGVWDVAKGVQDLRSNPLAGLDSLFPGQTSLRLADDGCKDLRPEVWRWFTYQFTHIGLAHVMNNCIATFVLGAPLEGLHGSVKMALMFNIGVLGGALNFFVSDAHWTVVGMSGGTYALVGSGLRARVGPCHTGASRAWPGSGLQPLPCGMHFANVVMNWAQLIYRVPMLVMLTLFVAADILTYYFSYGEEASHSTHVGGATAGLLIGILIGENLTVKWHERLLQAVSLFIGVLLVAFGVAWIITATPPKNIFEEESSFACWVRAIYDLERFGAEWRCIRCPDTACVAKWSNEENLRVISTAQCEELRVV